MCSSGSTMALTMVGFPIRTSTDQSLGGNSPWLIATSNVLLRLQAPRHPPLALHSLEKKDARARYGVLKGQWSTTLRVGTVERRHLPAVSVSTAGGNAPRKRNRGSPPSALVVARGMTGSIARPKPARAASSTDGRLASDQLRRSRVEGPDAVSH